MKDSAKIPPIPVILIAILAFSVASPLIRMAQKEAPSIVIAAFRMGFASLALFPLAINRVGPELRAASKWQITLLLLAGFLLALHFASWVSSLEYTSVASSVVLVATAPMWVALLSPLILKEKLAPPAWLGMIIAMTGSFIVGLSSECSFGEGHLSCSNLILNTSGTSLLGNFLALIGAWTSAGYLLIGRKIRRNFSLPSYTFSVYGIASLFLLTAVWFTGSRLSGYRPLTYFWVILLALIPQLVGHTMINWALKHISASYVSIAQLGEPVGTIILSYFILREKPTLIEIFGGMLILGGIYLVTNLESHSRQPQPFSG